MTEEEKDTFEEDAEKGIPHFEEKEKTTLPRHHLKTISDLTGMYVLPPSRTRPSRRERRSVSDALLMMNMPDEADGQGRHRYRCHHHRQGSTSDMITKFNNAGTLRDFDLHMAEAILTHGSRRERADSGISDMVHQQAIEKEEEEFPFNAMGLSSAEAVKLLEKHGKNELPEHVVPKWLIFLRQFSAPMPIMIWIAIIIEAAITNFLDMGILLFIQCANASIGFYETSKAGDAVAALRSSIKPTATCKRDGQWQVIDGTLIVPGDTVLLGSGSAVPADCRVNHSEIDVDQAALTGESLPVTFYKGDSCKMGSTVVRGEVEATVEFTGAETFFGKTASLLEDHHESSHLQTMLMSIMYVLVGLSIFLCIINFAYLFGSGVDVEESLSFTIVLLVASIPLAIEIVTTTTLAIGSKKLVAHGAIVSRLAAIEDLASMSILCSDKTGTLTLNQMVLQDDTPLYVDGESRESLLVFAAMAAKWKEPPRDALDRLTLGSVNMDLLAPYEQLDFMPFDPQIKRTEGTVKNTETGAEFKTTKGAPHVILQLLDPSEGDVQDAVEHDVARLGELGIRTLAVAKSDENGKWKMLGLLTFLDPPRADTSSTIQEAHELGVGVKMITGDHLLIARNTARQLNMGDRIFTAELLPMLDPETKRKPVNLSKNYGDLCLAADGFAQVFPEHKYLIVETLREMGYVTAMTGDGVNDAPALKRADVGIAVAGATDAARAAADIILTEEGLGTIIHGIVIAREIFQRINNFLTYRVAATLQLLCFFFIAIFAFHPWDYEQSANDEEWPEFFHMPVLMLMLITLLNDGTLITIAYDNAEASKTPNKWNLPALFVVSSTLGMVSCGSSLLLLWFLLDSWNEDGLIQKLGMDGVLYGEIITAIYLKVSVSDFLTLFSARTGHHFFWQVKPAPILLAGGCFALTLSTLLAVFWPEISSDGIPVQGLKSNPGMIAFVWLVSVLFWFVQDGLKVLMFRWMFKTNFNNINDTGVVELPESAQKLIGELDKVCDGNCLVAVPEQDPEQAS